MTNDMQEYNIAAIRKLLLAAFTAEELRRFCYDRPTFRPVVDEFSPDDGLNDMIDELIAYCETHLLFGELLTEVRKHNPRQYARFFGPDLPAVEVQKPQEDQPTPPTPALAPSASERDTITSPPIREDKKPLKVALPELTLEIPTILGPIPLHLVCVPAGEFVMGGVLAKDRDTRVDEQPPHRVDLPEFHIGKYPVTNLQYHAFFQATGHEAPDHWEGLGGIPLGIEDHPVVRVSWYDAAAFCAWLSEEIGQPIRLPTEAEWEKAARGTDARIYPWGDEPPDEKKCNFKKNINTTTPVGQYSPQGDSPYGCADMAGNVYEWCQNEPYPYKADDGQEDLKARAKRVLRGGSFVSAPERVRCAFRHRYTPDGWHINIGFRVAKGPLG